MSHITPHSTVNIHGPPTAARAYARPLRRAAVTLGAAAVLAGAASLPAIVPASATAAEAPAAPAAPDSPVVAPTAADSAAADAAIQRLRADGMLYENEITAAPQDIDFTELATEYGKKFIGLAFSKGGPMALNYVLAELGYAPEDEDAELFKALDEIRDSLAALDRDVQEIKQKLEQLLHGQDKINFYNSYTDAGLAASHIDIAMHSVAAWMEYGIEPSDQNVSDMHTLVKVSLEELEFMTTNPMTGTIPLMMKAAPEGSVIDLSDYYEAIDTARASYRTIYAQGLGTLDMLLEWDHDGTIGAEIGFLTEDAVDAVHDSYLFGVVPERPDVGNIDQKLVAIKNGDGTSTMLTSREGHAGNGWRDTTTVRRSEFGPIFEVMNEYVPQGGATLEQFLEERGVPTAIVWNDEFHHNEQRGNFNATGKRWVNVMPRTLLGVIEGDRFFTTHVDLAGSRQSWREACAWWGAGPCSPHNGDERSGKNDVMRWVANTHSLVRHYAREGSGSWTPPNASWRDATSRVMVQTFATTNVAGWATDFDADRIEEAAFSTDTEE